MVVTAVERGREDLMPVAGVPAEATRLGDGSELVLRELAPDDEGPLRGFYLGLSAATLYRRFMTPIPRLPERTLAYLACPGGSDRGVVVACHGDAIVGEARYHRLAGTTHAEVAVVVADGWQGRGLGRALTGCLRTVARRDGITAFGGAMLADNRAARGLLASTAPHADCRISDGELEFAAPLLPEAVPALRPRPPASATASGGRPPARIAG